MVVGAAIETRLKAPAGAATSRPGRRGQEKASPEPTGAHEGEGGDRGQMRGPEQAQSRPASQGQRGAVRHHAGCPRARTPRARGRGQRPRDPDASGGRRRNSIGSWARRCRSAAARIIKVHLCAGEWVLWPGKALSYRGRPERWPEYVAALMREEGVTDLILFGDCRFYHAQAILAARALRVRLHLFEEGYLRPHWITLEHQGVNAFSDFPRDPKVLLEEAERLGPAPKPRIYHDRFSLRALWDVAWNSNLILGTPAYPHYRRHAHAAPGERVCRLAAPVHPATPHRRA